MTESALGRALRALSAGENVSQVLSSEGILPLSDAELIEVMYEVQAGSYTQAAADPSAERDRYLAEMAAVLGDHVDADSSLLDVGTGEATTLLHVLATMSHTGPVKAIDISWSRLSYGKSNSLATGIDVEFAVANLGALPLGSGSVDWVISAHALEPNGGREVQLLVELARVARKGLILVEPDWDRASPQQRDRMSRLGYIGSLAEAAVEAGLQLVEALPFRVSLNPLNASTAFVFDVSVARSEYSDSGWVDPVEHRALEPFGGGLRTRAGQWFPVLAGIPFLRTGDGLLAARPAPDVLTWL